MTNDERSNLVNTIFVLANFSIMSNFLMFRFASAPERLTLTVTAISWLIFIAAVVSVNTWLYLKYYRKPKRAV